MVEDIWNFFPFYYMFPRIFIWAGNFVLTSRKIILSQRARLRLVRFSANLTELKSNKVLQMWSTPLGHGCTASGPILTSRSATRARLDPNHT